MEEKNQTTEEPKEQDISNGRMTLAFIIGMLVIIGGIYCIYKLATIIF